MGAQEILYFEGKSKQEMKAGKAVGQTTVAFDLAY